MKEVFEKSFRMNPDNDINAKMDAFLAAIKKNDGHIGSENDQKKIKDPPEKPSLGDQLKKLFQ